MKSMTCKELGGACGKIFSAETFEEIAEMSKNHGIKMYQMKDKAHLEAMQKMQSLLQDPEAMNKWYSSKRATFDARPNH